MKLDNNELKKDVVILIAEDSHTQALHLQRTLENQEYKVHPHGF